MNAKVAHPYLPSARATVPLFGIDPELNSDVARFNFDLVLFLDFDGVLRAPFQTSFEGCKYLKDALSKTDPHSSVPIVICSDWRLNARLQDLKKHFPKELANRLIGVTPDLMDQGGTRGREVAAWMNQHARGANWLAIDDQPRWYGEYANRVFEVKAKSKGGPGWLDRDTGRSLELKLTQMLSQRQERKLGIADAAVRTMKVP